MIDFLLFSMIALAIIILSRRKDFATILIAITVSYCIISLKIQNENNIQYTEVTNEDKK